MSNLYLIAVLFITAFTQAQIVTIPDANFKFNLISGNNVDNDGDGNYDDDVDINHDGQVQVSEAQAVVRLLVQSNSFHIGTIEGIESFTNLEDFESNNKILNADFSQNVSLIKIDMNFNESETITLPASSNLKEAHLFSCYITSIDVTQNPNLEILWVRSTLITSLDISQNPNLWYIEASGAPLSSLDVTHNPNLRELYVSSNTLTSLDVTQNPNLERLVFNECAITEIDLSGNPNLKVFAGEYNPLQSLDFSQNPMVNTIRVGHTQLSSLNVKNGHNNILDNLIATFNPALDCIQVDDVNYANSKICDEGFYGWCRDNNTRYSEDCTLNVSSFENINLKIYPNPANNVLNIEYSEALQSVKIYSLEGRLVIEVSSPTIDVSSPTIDVSSLSSGLYFVKLFANGKTITKKFLKS